MRRAQVTLLFFFCCGVHGCSSVGSSIKEDSKKESAADKSDDVWLRAEAMDARWAFERAKRDAGLRYNLGDDPMNEYSKEGDSDASYCYRSLDNLSKTRRMDAPKLDPGGAYTVAEREKHASDPLWRYDLTRFTIETSDGRMALAAVMERCRSLAANGKQ